MGRSTEVEAKQSKQLNHRMTFALECSVSILSLLPYFLSKFFNLFVKIGVMNEFCFKTIITIFLS